MHSLTKCRILLKSAGVTVFVYNTGCPIIIYVNVDYILLDKILKVLNKQKTVCFIKYVYLFQYGVTLLKVRGYVLFSLFGKKVQHSK